MYIHCIQLCVLIIQYSNTKKFIKFMINLWTRLYIWNKYIYIVKYSCSPNTVGIMNIENICGDLVHCFATVFGAAVARYFFVFDRKFVIISQLFTHLMFEIMGWVSEWVSEWVSVRRRVSMAWWVVANSQIGPIVGVHESVCVFGN